MSILHKKSRLILAGAVVLVFIIALAIFFVERSKNNQVKVAFYALPQNIQAALTEQITQIHGSSKAKLAFITLDKNTALQAALKKEKYIDLLFAYNGQNVRSIQKQLAAVSPKGLALMPSSLRSVSTKNNSTILPLLIDNMEIAANDVLLGMAKQEIPQMLGELQTFTNYLQKSYSPQIYCAGKNDQILLMLVSALLETRYGYKAYNALNEALIAAQQTQAGLETVLQDKTLTAVLDEIKNMQTTKMLHHVWFDMTEKDLIFFMDENLAPVVFMPLSLHRQIEFRITKRYASSYFPSSSTSKERSFIAPLVVGMSIAKKDSAESKTLQSYLNALVQVDVQANLSLKTGLAPANSSASAADVQASDVRYWVAASESPLPGLYHSAFLTPEAAGKFAALVRAYLKN